MQTSSIGRQLIEEYEGLILGAYDDYNDAIVKPGQTVRGTLTIGYGHTSSAGTPKVYVGQRITKAQADSILASDLKTVEQQVTSRVKVPLNQNQFDALVSFTFNCGPGALGRSAILKYVNAKQWQKAGDAFMQWTRGNGQVLAGLVRRRKAERALFLKPYTAPTSNGATKTVVTGAVVAAGTAAATTHPEHWLWIGLGTLAIIILGFLGFELYKKETH